MREKDFFEEYSEKKHFFWRELFKLDRLKNG